MTVRELIETLETFPAELPAVVESGEVEEIVIREEIYYSSDDGYKDGTIVKIC